MLLLNDTVWLPLATLLEEHKVLVILEFVVGVFSEPPKMMRVPSLTLTAPSVSRAAAPILLPPALPGPLTITTPPDWVNEPLLSIPSVSPFVGTSTSNKPPLTLTLGLELPLVALTPSSVA